MQSKKSGLAFAFFVIVAVSVFIFAACSGVAAVKTAPIPTEIPATPTETATPGPPTATPGPVDVVFVHNNIAGLYPYPDPSLYGSILTVRPDDALTVLGQTALPRRAYFVRATNGTEGWLIWERGMFELPDGANVPRIEPKPASPNIPTKTSTAVPARPRPTSGSQTGPCSCNGDIYNCSDFSSQSAAQACFNHCSFDVHNLDADSDGRVCESLP